MLTFYFLSTSASVSTVEGKNIYFKRKFKQFFFNDLKVILL